MKSREKAAKVKVSPNRMTRADRKRMELSQMSSDELMLCRQNGEFHKAYLGIELAYEEEIYKDLQERLAALQSEPVEAADMFETFEKTEFAFD